MINNSFSKQFQRRERLASETQKRRERHARAMEDVAREAEAWESESGRRPQSASKETEREGGRMGAESSVGSGPALERRRPHKSMR